MVTNDDKMVTKKAPKFLCEICDYSTSKPGNFATHLSTEKHKMVTNGDKMVTKLAKQATDHFACDCGRTYKYRQGLHRHQKNCLKTSQQNSATKFSDISNKDLIVMLINDNKSLREFIVEQSKEKDEYKNIMIEHQNRIIKALENGTTTTNTINNTNCHNKAFNLNFFLNETCKDAMNLTDFIESIKFQVSDLEKIGEVGYVEGISNIITTNLKALDITERPVHCTDKKRETIYIKDDNKWEKDDDNKSHLRKVISKVACKGYKLLPAYREKYPGCQYADSKYSDKYNKTVIEAMGGAGNNDTEKEDKIIKNITKVALVNKDKD